MRTGPDVTGASSSSVTRAASDGGGARCRGARSSGSVAEPRERARRSRGRRREPPRRSGRSDGRAGRRARRRGRAVASAGVPQPRQRSSAGAQPLARRRCISTARSSGVGLGAAGEQPQRVAHQAVDVGPGLAPEHHAIGEIQHVAAGGEAIEVCREASQRLQQLAAQQEGQVRRRRGRKTTRTWTKGSSVPAKRRREFFAPLAMPVTLPCCSVMKVTIRSDSPYGRARSTNAGVAISSDTGGPRGEVP